MIDYKSSVYHINMICARWRGRIKPKYVAGQQEHGGRLWRKPAMDFITEEIADLAVYWDVAMEQQADLKVEVGLALGYCDPKSPAYKHILRAANILSFGNAEGEVEEEKNGYTGQIMDWEQMG